MSCGSRGKAVPWVSVCPSSPWSQGSCFCQWKSKVWTADPTARANHCCRLSARVGCRVRGGAAWQTEGEEGGGEGSRPWGGRAEGETEEGEGEGGEALLALPGARSEA